GDTNGDGYDDLVVGMPDYLWTLPGEGAAFLYGGEAR
ncbi:MAG: FG-GAP repeat protein, partial [Myxococcales bacterium]|nr:FG-GAP repeat protein [Myxococcales bacterium]